jgi:hypothetical protein
MVSFSLYIHIPFCRHRCGYCDFNTYAGLEDLIPPYVEALCEEIAFSADAAQSSPDGWAASGERLPVHSLFFGGGTPSLLNAGQLEQILQVITDNFNLAQDVEITLEANPGTLSSHYLKDLHSLGVNRLSLGVQSANPLELRLLERQHDFSQVIESVKWAHRSGLDNINLDLIFGLPEQALETWQHTLILALGLAPDHFSLYALTIEPHFFTGLSVVWCPYQMVILQPKCMNGLKEVWMRLAISNTRYPIGASAMRSVVCVLAAITCSIGATGLTWASVQERMVLRLVFAPPMCWRLRRISIACRTLLIRSWLFHIRPRPKLLRKLIGKLRLARR